MKSVIFREAVRADMPWLLSLLEQLFGIEEDFNFNPERQKKGLAQLIDSPAAIVMVAEKEGEVVGMATGQVLISTAEGGPALLVEDVSVDSACRNQGVGSRLLEELAKKAEERGAFRMQLLADKYNNAGLLFYEKLGWAKTALICLRKYGGGW